MMPLQRGGWQINKCALPHSLRSDNQKLPSNGPRWQKRHIQLSTVDGERNRIESNLPGNWINSLIFVSLLLNLQSRVMIMAAREQWPSVTVAHYRPTVCRIAAGPLQVVFVYRHNLICTRCFNWFWIMRSIKQQGSSAGASRRIICCFVFTYFDKIEHYRSKRRPQWKPCHYCHYCCYIDCLSRGGG